jgi:hypothetical protein
VGLLVGIKERLNPRSLPDERLVLEQQLRKQVGLVQARHQTGLDRLAGKVDEKLKERKEGKGPWRQRSVTPLLSMSDRGPELTCMHAFGTRS